MRMIAERGALLLLALTSACMTQRPLLVRAPHDAPGAPSTLFEHVRVFTGRADSLTEPLDVLVESGRISAIGAPGTLSMPDDGERVDGSGKTLLPGLIDCHVHLGGGDGTPPWASDIPNVDAQAAEGAAHGLEVVVLVAEEGADGRSVEGTPPGVAGGLDLLAGGRERGQVAGRHVLGVCITLFPEEGVLVDDL